MCSPLARTVPTTATLPGYDDVAPAPLPAQRWWVLGPAAGKKAGEWHQGQHRPGQQARAPPVIGLRRPATLHGPTPGADRLPTGSRRTGEPDRRKDEN